MILGKVDLSTVIRSDGWRGYGSLFDICFDRHFKVNHGEWEFARGECRICGIESFLSYTKRCLAKFIGTPAKTFELHLKETESRINHRHDNLYLALLKLLRNNSL